LSRFTRKGQFRPRLQLQDTMLPAELVAEKLDFCRLN